MAESERLAARADIDVQVGWRMTRGRILSVQHRHEEASAILREALLIAQSTEYICHLADVLMTLAHAQRAAHRSAEARGHYVTALSLYERKEYAVLASRARSFLERL